MVPELHLEQTDTGLVPDGEGWFVLNARDARWVSGQGRGARLIHTAILTRRAHQIRQHIGRAQKSAEHGGRGGERAGTHFIERGFKHMGKAHQGIQRLVHIAVLLHRSAIRVEQVVEAGLCRTATKVRPIPALSAVLLYRLISFWGVLVVGGIAWWALRRKPRGAPSG